MEENFGLYAYNRGLTPEMYLTARYSQADTNVLDRWFYPGYAEQAQFDKENYFVNMENLFNEYMFDKTNAYNDPSAQIQRMKNAGINPNLAAAGIAGTGAGMATPMAGARGDTGMNTNASSPIDQITNAIGGASTLMEGIGKAGEIFGFGAKNKAEIKQINAAVNKMGEEAQWTKEQRREAKDLFPYIKENTIKEGKQTDQNIENLRQLYRLYKEQVKTQEQITDLTQEQVSGQQKENELSDYKIWEEKFYKAFRDLTGANAKDHWINMLVEATMNKKGDAIIDNIAQFIGNVLKSAIENITTFKDKFNEEQKDQLMDFILGKKLNGKWKNFKNGYEVGKEIAQAYKEYKEAGGKMGYLQFYKEAKRQIKEQLNQ